MRYLQVVESRVVTGKMQDFTGAVQQWQRAVLSHADGPTHQSLLVDSQDPSRVLLLTEFEDEDHSRRFSLAGLDQSLLKRIDSYCHVAGEGRRYTIFYESGRRGPEVIFGQETKTAP